jgi:hypothetical protein
MKRAARAGLAALVLAFCACSSNSGHVAKPPAHTLTKTFHAYAANGDLSVQVADIATGTCWTTSIAAPVAGAYRCISEDRIYDPCFAPAHPVAPIQVACVAAPWSEAEVLRVTGQLPHSAPLPGSPRPWAIQLSNGARCVAVTGTVPQVNGVDLGFHCANGRDAALVSNAASLAVAEYGTPTATALRRVTVTTIWRV